MNKVIIYFVYRIFILYIRFFIIIVMFIKFIIMLIDMWLLDFKVVIVIGFGCENGIGVVIVWFFVCNGVVVIIYYVLEFLVLRVVKVV